MKNFKGNKLVSNCPLLNLCFRQVQRSQIETPNVFLQVMDNLSTKFAQFCEFQYFRFNQTYLKFFCNSAWKNMLIGNLDLVCHKNIILLRYFSHPSTGRRSSGWEPLPLTLKNLFQKSPLKFFSLILFIFAHWIKAFCK